MGNEPSMGWVVSGVQRAAALGGGAQQAGPDAQQAGGSVPRAAEHCQGLPQHQGFLPSPFKLGPVVYICSFTLFCSHFLEVHTTTAT